MGIINFLIKKMHKSVRPVWTDVCRVSLIWSFRDENSILYTIYEKLIYPDFYKEHSYSILTTVGKP